MKKIFKSIALASLGLAILFSCTKNEPVVGTADGNGQMKLSVTGVLGEYKAAEGTKASLVNTPRVGWNGDETVHVFQQSDGKYLGSLTSSVKATGASVATLGGTISSGTGTLVFVYTNATMPSLTAGTAYTSLEISLAEQGTDIPFVVYGTAESPGTTNVSGLVVNFSFATSVVSTYAAGLPANTAVTKATLSSINTKCVLTIPSSGDITVSGSTSGIITKSTGISSTNAQGQVLFEIAVPASEAASGDRSIEFTVNGKTCTTAFSGAAIAAGNAYSAMSVSEVEKVILDKTTLQTYVTITQTLTATAYPDNSSKVLTWTSSNDAVATVDQTGKVTGMAEGTATITVALKDEASIKATCTVTVESDYVEMNMGTGETAYTRKWRRLNLGATTVAGSGETCFGDYYAWGEIEPYYLTRTWDGTNKKWNFKTWYTSKSSGYSWQSYCGQSSYTEWTQPPYDSDTKNLTGAYDVATQKLSNDWRMPTSQEFKDLADACGGSSTYDEDTYKSPATCGEATTFSKGIYWCENYDGVAGCLFCDGTNKLFFPAAGYGSYTWLYIAGSRGYYWSSSRYSSPNLAYYLYFFSGNVNPQTNDTRYGGFSVRPVSD